MTATTETLPEDAPAPKTPKRKLTIANAIDQWAETTHAMEGLKMLRDEAAQVLLAHFEKTDRRTFKDRIAVVDTGGTLVLSQAAVRDDLPPERFVEGDLMTRTRRGHSLKLLK